MITAEQHKQHGAARQLTLEWSLIALIDRKAGTGMVVSRHKTRELAERAATKIKGKTKVAHFGAVRIGQTCNFNAC